MPESSQENLMNYLWHGIKLEQLRYWTLYKYKPEIFLLKLQIPFDLGFHVSNQIVKKKIALPVVGERI